MTTKFTPRSWVSRASVTSEGHSCFDIFQLIDEGFLYLGEIHDEADANLIAAAPDMYEALIQLIYIATHFPLELSEDHYSVTQAEEILAKAQGVEAWGRS